MFIAVVDVSATDNGHFAIKPLRRPRLVPNVNH